MVWSYNGKPSTNPSDRNTVRFIIGDIIELRPLFQDEELDYLLLKNSGDNNSAAIDALQIKITELSLYGDGKLGAFEFDFSSVIENMKATLSNLRASQSTSSSMFYAGGISISDKEANNSNEDLVFHRFYRGQHDNYEP